MTALMLVRYGELTLKSAPVRREFERVLRRNVLEQFTLAGLSCRLRTDHGHLYVEADDASSAARLLRRVFGITSMSEVFEAPTEFRSIREELLRRSDRLLVPDSRFAVRARRTGQHPFTSQELARDLGAAVLETFADRRLTVDLEHPTVELAVEVRGPRTYLSFDRVRGPGGIPLGVAGRLVAAVDGPRGALGAYLMMKRGCRSSVVAWGPGEALARSTLTQFDPKIEITVPGDDWASEVRAAADRRKVDGVVLPLEVDDYPSSRATWGDLVLFSPTVGLTDEEVGDRWSSVESLAV